MLTRVSVLITTLFVARGPCLTLLAGLGNVNKVRISSPFPPLYLHSGEVLSFSAEPRRTGALTKFRRASSGFGLFSISFV
jgi:hypothetical protein